MTKPGAQALLEAVRNAVSHRKLYGPDHHLAVDAVEVMASAADDLVGTARRVVVSALDGTLYLDGRPLPGMSIGFDGLIGVLADKDVESLTFEAPVSVEDCTALTAYLCGQGDGPGAHRSIAINEDQLIHAPSEHSRVDVAYTTSLEALRAVGVSLHKGTGIELTRATSAVRTLLDELISEPGAAFLLTTVKSHHEYTFYHSINTSILALALGRLVGLDDDDLVVLGLGAMLHDIGKIGVSASILRNPGQLSPSDWAEIERHPQLGAEAILAATRPGQEAAAVVAFEHHARFDGRGYPVAARPLGDHDGRSGLHFFSRLVSVVDTYDAITTRRSYRRAETPTRALSTLLHGAGTSHDPDFVHAFIRMMGIYPPGTLLRMADGQVVMVSHPSDKPDAPPYGVIVADTWGNESPELEPVRISLDEVQDQLAAERIGLDPTRILERITERDLLAAG